MDRIVLRNYKQEDSELLYKEIGLNNNMLKFTGWNPYKNLIESRKIVEDKIKDSYSWIIDCNGVSVGSIGAYDYNADDKSIEIGYSIFESFWNKGFGKEALKLACEILFKDNGIDLIRAWAVEENIGSIRILEACGFIKKDIVDSTFEISNNIYTKLIFEKYKNL